MLDTFAVAAIVPFLAVVPVFLHFAVALADFHFAAAESDAAVVFLAPFQLFDRFQQTLAFLLKLTKAKVSFRNLQKVLFKNCDVIGL